MCTLSIAEQKWKLVAGKSHQDFVKKIKDSTLASDTQAARKILIFRENDIKRIIRAYIPEKKGWRIQKTPSYTYARHDFDDIIVDIGKKISDDNDYFKLKTFFYPVFEQILEKGGLILHSALIEKDNKGILLIGSNGIGKSTCCKILPHPWRARGDDTAIVKKGKAYPFPTWSNFLQKKHRTTQRNWDTGRGTEIKLICFLAQGKEDKLIDIKKGEAIQRVMDSVWERSLHHWFYLDRETLRKLRMEVFEGSLKLLSSIPFRILQVKEDSQYWEKIEEVI